MSEKRTDIKDLGEFGLIDTLTKNFTTHVSTTLKGVGDDAAVISISETEAMFPTFTTGSSFTTGYIGIFSCSIFVIRYCPQGPQ